MKEIIKETYYDLKHQVLLYGMIKTLFYYCEQLINYSEGNSVVLIETELNDLLTL